MHNHSQHLLTVTSYTDQVCNIAERLGFWPADSVVAIWRKGESELLVQRVDIPDPGWSALVSDSAWWTEFARPGNLHDATSVGLLVVDPPLYSDSSDLREMWLTTLSDQLVRKARECLNQSGITVEEVVLVHESTLTCVDCTPSCELHRVSTQSMPSTIDLSRADAAAAVAFAPERGLSLQIQQWAESRLQVDSSTWCIDELNFLENVLVQPPPLSDSLIARCAQALAVVSARDTLLWDIAAGDIASEASARFLCSMLPSLHGPVGAPVATVAGICWWLSGNGAKANLCLHRAHECQSDDPLALLVAAAVGAGLPPSIWVESVLELHRDECLRGGELAESK